MATQWKAASPLHSAPSDFLRKLRETVTRTSSLDFGWIDFNLYLRKICALDNFVTRIVCWIFDTVRQILF